jgi:hypothetical protein
LLVRDLAAGASTVRRRFTSAIVTRAVTREVEQVAPLLPLVKRPELRPEQLVQRIGGHVGAADEPARSDVEPNVAVSHDREVLA